MDEKNKYYFLRELGLKFKAISNPVRFLSILEFVDFYALYIIIYYDINY